MFLTIHSSPLFLCQLFIRLIYLVLFRLIDLFAHAKLVARFIFKSPQREVPFSFPMAPNSRSHVKLFGHLFQTEYSLAYIIRSGYPSICV